MSFVHSFIKDHTNIFMDIQYVKSMCSVMKYIFVGEHQNWQLYEKCWGSDGSWPKV